MRVKDIRFVSMALLAALLTPFHRTASAQVVSTLAGSGAPGSVDGSGEAASFVEPIQDTNAFTTYP